MQAFVNVYVYVVVLALSAGIVLYSIIAYWKKRFAGVKHVQKKKESRNATQEGGEHVVQGARVGPGSSAAAARRRLAGRMATQRVAEPVVERVVESEEEHSSASESSEKEIATSSSKKIGVKKQRKLEEKKARKEERELMEREREERKRREAKEEKEKKEREAQEAKEEAMRLEQLRLQKEEEERREAEEYARMKEEFSIEDEGEDAVKINDQFQQDFAQHIKLHKVVMIEELASAFRLKTKECVDLIHGLIETNHLSGVLDDRGKFIYITQSEYEAVARFIRQRGRVTIKELAENSNRLIQLGEAHFQQTVHSTA